MVHFCNIPINVDGESHKHPDVNAEPPMQSLGWTPQRHELHEWLKRSAPSLAELYSGVVMLLFERPIPGYTRLVSHSIREIKNRLPDAISGSTAGGRINYKGRLDEIAETWHKAGFQESVTTDRTSPTVYSRPTEISIPRKLWKQIGYLVADHNLAREKPIDSATRLFIGTMAVDEKFFDAIRPAVLQWLDVTNWFMKRAHDSGTTDASYKIEEFQTKFEIFETTLLGIIRAPSTFFVTTDELDEILKDTNS